MSGQQLVGRAGAVRAGVTIVPLADAYAPLGFGLAASAATLAGGTLGLRFADRIGLVLGLTAGIVLGVAIFDLMPEAYAVAGAGEGAHAVPAWLAIGFTLYMAFRRAIERFGHADVSVHLAPAMLTLHSFTDGFGIGLGFQVSPAAGGLLAAAVLTHDLADGVNTVSLCLAAGRRRAARVWLAVNGAAPVLGVAAGLLVPLPRPYLTPFLSAFAGAFLFIGACELVPRSHVLDPRLRTTLASVVGVALMFAVTTLAH